MWLIPMSDMAHFYEWHGSFLWVTWLIHVCIPVNLFEIHLRHNARWFVCLTCASRPKSTLYLMRQNLALPHAHKNIHSHAHAHVHAHAHAHAHTYMHARIRALYIYKNQVSSCRMISTQNLAGNHPTSSSNLFQKKEKPKKAKKRDSVRNPTETKGGEHRYKWICIHTCTNVHTYKNMCI